MMEDYTDVFPDFSLHQSDVVRVVCQRHPRQLQLHVVLSEYGRRRIILLGYDWVGDLLVFRPSSLSFSMSLSFSLSLSSLSLSALKTSYQADRLTFTFTVTLHLLYKIFPQQGAVDRFQVSGYSGIIENTMFHWEYVGCWGASSHCYLIRSRLHRRRHDFIRLNCREQSKTAYCSDSPADDQNKEWVLELIFFFLPPYLSLSVHLFI